MTADDGVDSVIEAMRLGAYDYLVKPLDLDRLDEVVERCVEGLVQMADLEASGVAMNVLRFWIVFGTPIWSRLAGKDTTEYCIASIPLGGYVRFLDSREGPVPPEDEGRAFNHRPIPQRIAVLVAGPLFNFLFAILAFWGVLVIGETGFLERAYLDGLAEHLGLDGDLKRRLEADALRNQPD